MQPDLQQQNFAAADRAVTDTVTRRASQSPYYNSPTVVTDANIRESVIPAIKEKSANLLDPRIKSTTGSTLIIDPNTPGYTKSAVDRYLAENGSLDSPYADIYKGMSDGGNTTTDIAGDPNYTSAIALLDEAKSINDNQYNSTVDSIKSKYKVLTDKLATGQAAQTDAITQALNLGGTSRYAPVSASGIMSSKIKYDVESLAALQDEESSLISQAQTARSAKDFQLLEQRLGLIEEKRKEKNALAQKINDDLVAQNKAIRENNIRSSRDSAIASLMQQGITDPTQILGYLNFDESGKQIGDFTADEIGKTLKSIAPDNNLEKLSGTTRDFFILKGQGKLPGNISSLPEEQQLFAYLASEKRAGASGGTPNKLTLSEVTTRGLPISTVGMSEEDITQSIYEPTPPAWFIEKLNAEKGINATVTIGGKQIPISPEGQSIDPNMVRSTWNEYRQKFITGGLADKPTENYKKAEQYFGATYEGLSKDDLATIAKTVETYVNGGMSYADAVEQTKKDLK